MVEISEQIKDAIKGAILLEINGRKFFNHAADVTKHESGKKMFRFLAQEEVKHLKTFSDLFSQILGEKDWKKYISSHELEGEAPLVEKLKERMRREEGKGETEALSIGMQLEMDAISFFQKAAEETDDPVTEKIFREIAEEEKFHYDLLQSQHDSVTKSGFWLDSAEFQMDGKW
ncbi:MAG: ferritin family protein [Candidatus Aminicenantes bacterium]|nr:ferritin family protein [Candidatus Aminicenantes bacterium]